MKTLKILAFAGGSLLILCVFVFVARVGMAWLTFASSNALHEKKIQQATQIMTAYRPEDWRDLFESCVNLYKTIKPSNTAIDRKQWPAQLVSLNPYYVWVDDDCIWMNWTGGFDDFGLHLYIYRREATLPNDGSHHAGVRVVDTRGKITEWPYIRNEDKKSQVAPPSK